MEKHRALTLKRLATFQNEIKKNIYTQRQPLNLLHAAFTERVPWQQAVQADFQPIDLGVRLGPIWSTHWFKLQASIPVDWTAREVHLLWDSSSEACLWQDGTPLQGLTGSSNGWQEEAIRTAYCLTKKAQGAEHVDLMVEAAMNGLFGVSTSNPRRNEGIGWLRQAELAVFDRNLWDLYWDFVIIADLARYLPQDAPRAGQALATANTMVNAILLDDPASWPLARKMAAPFLAQENGTGQHQLSVIGHAHIDTAWLWPMAETKRKCVRTFSSALQLMEVYPHFRFVCSQAQQLDWIRTEYPALYERILARVKSGQFIPAGATWVEPDTNVPSGESLVRQFLYGQRFFKEQFGSISRVFWEPDVFGYSAALPQIMRLSGVDYFLTQKLSWNEFNLPERNSFRWEGLDGSHVLAHFPPVDTYNSLATVKEVLFNVANFRDHERANESYLLYGYGDGGGGPSAEMLEQLNRMENVSGLPLVQQRAPEEFFERCEADLKDPTVWVGELYFENHRGTYTTQAAVKRDNRRSEELLHDLEFLGSLAFMRTGYPYAREALTSLWKQVLTNQFHDILPGSSIAEVYQDTAKVYRQVFETGRELKSDLLTRLVSASEGYSVINTLGCRRMEVIELPEGENLSPDEHTAPLAVVDLAPYSICGLQQAIRSDERRVTTVRNSTGFQLENDLISVQMNLTGQITSLIERASNRQCLQPGQAANQLVLYEDLPYDYDAWNVDVYYREKILDLPQAISACIVEEQPLRCTLQFEYKIGAESYLTQTISLTAVSARLDFRNTVVWQEAHAFMRVLFPLNLRSEVATYETQFGLLQRPTHFNTSYDLARFEVPALRWADLSEPDFGVALLNESKYGYACHGSELSLSLLRAPKDPDPLADMGAHQFAYALLPHALTPQLSAVWWQAAAFNQPIALINGQPLHDAGSLAQVDAPNIVLDTIKVAEDNQDIILRCYEASGSLTSAVLRFALPFETAVRCDLLERDLEPLPCDGNSIKLMVKPFEIISIRLKR